VRALDLDLQDPAQHIPKEDIMSRKTSFRARPTDHLRHALPPDAVPMRPLAGAWGLVVIAVRTALDAATLALLAENVPATADPAPTADLMAGVWLPTPPPAYRHDGDVVVRLHAPTDTDDPAIVDVEVIAAEGGVWHRVDVWRSVGADWPHMVAPAVLARMRLLADADFTDGQRALLGGPLTDTMPDALLADLLGEAAASPRLRRAPEALAALIAAGLVEVGEQLVLDEHTATVREGGVLHDGGPRAFAVYAVTALATSLTECTVNGWHLWRRARDHRLLAELRTELATH
jgi:hypothetical protein